MEMENGKIYLNSEDNCLERHDDLLILTKNIIFPVIRTKVGESHGVLDINSELLRVLEERRLAGQLLVVLHGRPGGDLTEILS